MMNDPDRRKMQITRMKMEHIPQIAAIEAETFSEPWSEKGFADTLTMDHVLFYVAVTSGQVTGYCGIYLAADEGELTNIAVATGFRRRNIACQLLDTALPQAFAKGAGRIYLEVRRSNAPAISLYEKYGFSVAGIRKGFYQFPQEDALVMMKEFADNDTKDKEKLL